MDRPNKDPDAVTFSRVAACYHVVACQYTSIARDRMVSETEMWSVCPGYPLSMMCQHFTALIPIEETHTKS